jgi:FMN phosphatase YigB (HAD superfamily)/DNA-binding XRE family transcriptional regulator
MDEQSLGRHLQSARIAAGLTQQELCQRAQISYSTLAKIERGAIKSPSVFTIQRLAEVLGTTLDALMGVVSQPGAVPLKARGRSRNGVTFVYFDINGCLVRFFHRAFNELAHDSGASADAIETTFWHYNDAVCRGEMTMDDFNRSLAEQLHTMVDWKQYYMSAVDPILEMHDLVRWASEHYQVGLLSNIMPGFIEEMMASGLLPQVPYTTIIDSSKVGAIKPEKHIYEIAQEQAGVPAQEILLVDDSRTNVMAAEHMGWKVMWFDDFRPDESVARVRQALELADPNAPAPPAPTAVSPEIVIQPAVAPVVAPGDTHHNTRAHSFEEPFPVTTPEPNPIPHDISL